MASNYPDDDYVEMITSFKGNVTIRKIKAHRGIRKPSRLFNNGLDRKVSKENEKTTVEQDNARSLMNKFSNSMSGKLKCKPATTNNIPWVSDIYEGNNSEDSITIIEIHSEPEMGVGKDFVTSMKGINEVLDEVANLKIMNNETEELKVHNEAIPLHFPGHLGANKYTDCQSDKSDVNPSSKTPITLSNKNNKQVQDTRVKIPRIVELAENNNVKEYKTSNKEEGDMFSDYKLKPATHSKNDFSHPRAEIFEFTPASSKSCERVIITPENISKCVNIKDEVNTSCSNEMCPESGIVLDDDSNTSKLDFFQNLSMNREDECMDDSFLKLEHIVTKLCTSPTAKENLNNTLEIVDFVLNKEYSKETKDLPSKKPARVENINESLNLDEGNIVTEQVKELQNASPLHAKENLVPFENLDLHVVKLDMNTPSCAKTPVTLYNELKMATGQVKSAENICDEYYKKANKKQNDKFNYGKLKTLSPLTNNLSNKNTNGNANNVENAYKTPKNILTKKQQLSSVKKSPATSNTYQDVMSPVAYYIKRSPQVPLIRNVHPKKLLPGATNIPCLEENVTENKISSKENVALPSIVYRRAKKTKVISGNDKKMPQNQWAKKLASSSPVVRKHVNRDGPHTKTPIPLQNEDSFANLSLINQADVSIHIEKPAFSS